MTIAILIADDHGPFRAALRSLLSAEPGVRVVAEAGDGEVAVRLAREHRPDVVLMDVSMPGCDGIEATRRIVANDPSVAVIGLSMHADAVHEEAIVAAGARCLVDKGGDAEAIWVAIRSWANASADVESPPRRWRGA